MITLITVAHRVSDVHAKYAEIHAAVFSISLARLKSRSTSPISPTCEYEQQLASLNEKLAAMSTTLRAGKNVSLSTTFDREFRSAMDEYIGALDGAIAQLAEICRQLCLDSKGVEAYEESKSRADRVAYDESIQRYQRLGKRLSLMFEKL